jgi:hypothetical protein
VNQHELLARLKHPEDQFVERKPESVPRGDIRKTLVAFANSVPAGKSAVLFIGVADDGRVVGCSNSDAKQKLIRQICEQDCYPAVRADCEVVETREGEVVAVIIGPSNDRPHFSGPAYIRRGSESVAASAELFDELIQSRTGLVAAILRHRNEVFTVHSIQHRLGDTRPIADQAFRQHAECRITECNAHFVRFFNISSRENYCEPLANIQFTRDENKYRPMLIVRG